MILLVAGWQAHAQLGFCNGNSGDAIFSENFGTGTGFVPLPAGVTTFNFANTFPDDGFYTVSNTTAGNPFEWHQVEDHTPNDVNGRCLIVNADFVPGEFYRTTVSGLCEATTYEFSAWLLNLLQTPGFCVNQGIAIPINVSFEIWDNSDTVLLASGATGDIRERPVPEWEKYGLVFQTLAGQNEVILKMINNGEGGCGNDLAIDDIEFKSCGDSVIVTDAEAITSIEVCDTQLPYNAVLTATPDFSVYSNHFYQWQQSTDGINWADIVGETNQNLSVTTNTTRFYRVKVAEFAANLNNAQCNSFSESYQIIVNELPPPPVLACYETATINDTTCSWDISGTQPPAPFTECWETATFNDTSCSWEITGTQPEPPEIECWETLSFNDTSCSWEVSGEKPVTVFEESRIICDDPIELIATTTFLNPEFTWDNSDTNDRIMVNSPGVYTVDIFDGDCSFETIIYEVTRPETPVIASVVSEGTDIIVNTANTGDFLYSLDGISFQNSNIFRGVEGGLYTIYVKDRDCNFTTKATHLHFIIPRYFTPNGDGFRDVFELKGIEFYNSSEVYIFDRYGKLLTASKNAPFTWDGTFNNQLLPSSDYWYQITIEGQIFRGHFTLKR